MSVSDAVKALAKERGLKQADIVKATGLSRGAVSKWFSGASQPSREVLPGLAELFGVPISYFYNEEVPKDYVHEVAAGSGRINDDSVKSGEYSTVRIVGDSMFPTLFDGDLVRVHHITDDITPSKYTIVKINGNESTCKHVEFTDKGIWLRAENKDVFEDKFYSIQEVMTTPITIIGVVEAIIERKL